MFIHYNNITNRVTGFTNFINPIPEVWNEPTIEIDSFEFLQEPSEYEIQNGVPVHVGKSQETIFEEFNLLVDEWKTQREELVNNIEVLHDGVIYQGDETSQDRMSRAINALPDDVITLDWIAKDNTVHALTRMDFKAMLLNAGLQQSTIWNDGRPTLGT